MPLPTRKINKKRLWIGIALGTLAFLFLVAFWPDINNILFILRNILFLTFDPIQSETWLSVFILIFTLSLGLIGAAILWIFLVSAQSLLPSSNFYEDENQPKSLMSRLHAVFRVALRLCIYIIRLHGPAIFIQDGKELSSPEEKQRSGPGVLVIDFNSAAILEQQLSTLLIAFRILIRRFTEMLGFSVPLEHHKGNGVQRSLPQRAHGPGVVYTSRMERIRGVIDLRKQSRFAKDVTAHTRDGIKLTANGIITLFSVGEEPDVIQVTFLNGRRVDDLCAVSVKQSGDTIEIAPLLPEELEDEDRLVILESIRKAKSNRRPYEPVAEISLLPTFNARRVFEAVASQAARGDTEIPWTDLPLQNSIKLFRDLISNYNYNLLSLDPEDPNAFNLTEINNRLRLKARNAGLLSYRFLFHRHGKLLEAGKNPIDQVRVSPIYPLPASQQAVLRDRGIKIIHAGFLPLRPVFEGVTRQRFDNWYAKWESEIITTRALHSLEAKRIYNQALANAQSEMITILTEIFRNQEFSQEAVALRVLQALENAAGNPETRRLVPSDTINLMKAAYDWLPPPKDKFPNNSNPSSS